MIAQETGTGLLITLSHAELSKSGLSPDALTGEDAMRLVRSLPMFDEDSLHGRSLTLFCAKDSLLIFLVRRNTSPSDFLPLYPM